MSNTGVTSKNESAGFGRTIRATLGRNRLGELLVLHGYISVYELKFALRKQMESDKPLGQILLEHNFISRYQLSTLLIHQKAMRLAFAGLLCIASLGMFSKKSQARILKDVPARIALENTSHIDDITRYPALFGASEKRSDNLKAFTKWSEMFTRFDASLNTAAGQRFAEDLREELSHIQSDSTYKMAQKVNAMMNEQKYILDNKNWGKSDYWATPIEFMSRGGDCEDFAIAKYAALRALGVPDNRMRVAIVQDLKKNIPHAVLVVYSEKGAIILDNQIKEARRADTISHYKPIYSINREAWWLHTTPEAETTTVAAAAQ